MRYYKKRKGIALISVILISAILVTSAVIALTRAGTEKQITSSDFAFRQALNTAETGVANVINSMRLNNTEVPLVGGATWIAFLKSAVNSTQTANTVWMPWLFFDEKAPTVLVTRGSYVAKVSAKAAVPVSGQAHTFDTVVTIACLGRAFAPNISQTQVTNPASPFLAQRAISTTMVVRWNDSFVTSDKHWVNDTDSFNYAILANGSLNLAGSWGAIQGNVRSNSSIDIQDNGYTMTGGVMTANSGITGKTSNLPAGSNPNGGTANFPTDLALNAKNSYAQLYQAYLTGGVPFDGTGTADGYENSSASSPISGMAAYISALQSDPANVAYWTHPGGVYFAPATSLPQVTYKKDLNGDGKDDTNVTAKGLELNGGVIQGKVIVIDGSLILKGNVTITADVLVVMGDIVNTAGTPTIHGTVLVGGSEVSATGNFHIYGSLLASDSLDMIGNFTVNHTGYGSTPFPGGHYEGTDSTTNAAVQNAFLPERSSAQRTWQEILPSAILP